MQVEQVGDVQRLAASASSSLLCTPPNPPLLMHRMWSPGRALATNLATSASMLSHTCASTTRHTMNPKDDESKKDVEALEVLLERMRKAGMVKDHGHSDTTKLVGAEFTADGIRVVEVIYSLNQRLAPLTAGQVCQLWAFLCKIGSKHARNRP